METQKQIILCPNCGSVQIGIAKNTWPHPTFIHDCTDCNYTIMESEWEEMKAISIQQPWAWLIVRPDLEGEARAKAIESGEIKNIENRKTLKNLKGKYLIHTGQKIDKNWFNYSKPKTRELLAFIKMPLISKMHKGGIVGIAEFNGSVQESDSPWFVGPNGLVIENAKPIDFIPCKGQQGIFYPKID